MTLIPPPPLSIETVPILLLPVRIETRFITPNGGPLELRVRVYPDQVHMDSHRPALTNAEVAAGQEYWLRRWNADIAHAQAAWADLSAVVRPRRAAWIVRQLTPTNPLSDNAPVFPAVAIEEGDTTTLFTPRALPSEWVFLAYNEAGQRVIETSGLPISPDLALGLGELDPDEDPTTKFLRWGADYEAAVAAGMAVTITEADAAAGHHRLASGFSKLVVVGVDRTSSAQGSADALEQLLLGHAYTEGLALLRAGTPTNNLDGRSAAGGGIPTADPSETVAPAPTADGSRLAQSLGLGPDSVVRTVPGAADRSDLLATSMLSALWQPLFGYFFERRLEGLMPAATVGAVRSFAMQHLRPTGSLPTMRVGRQPLAILAVLHPAAIPGNETAQKVRNISAQLRPIWQAAARRSRNLHSPEATGQGDVDSRIVELLRRGPWSTKYSYRIAMPPAVHANVPTLATLSTLQNNVRGLLKGVLKTATTPLTSEVVATTSQRVPGTAIGLRREDGTVDLDYLTAIRTLLATPNGRTDLVNRVPKSILEALLTYSGVLAIDNAVRRRLTGDVFIGDNRSTGAVWRPDQPTPSRDAARTVAGGRVAEVLGSEMKALVARPRFEPAAATDLGAMIALYRDLGNLRSVPPDALEIAMHSTIDTSSHRLDAWITAVATSVLADIRAERGAGVHVGGYAWVENVHPESTGRDSHGAYLAPSLGHATTAAILRSGYLAQDSADESMAIDLTSERTQRAAEMLAAAREGHPLAVLVGYRIERFIRDAGASVLISRLRRRAPFRPPDPQVAPSSTEPPVDVTDGVVLLEQWRADRQGLEAEILKSIANPTTKVRQALHDALVDADDQYDAVGDLIIAESVYQLARGQLEHAQATFDILDEQTTPPEFELPSTPRASRGVSFRVVIALSDTKLTGWEFDAAAAVRAIADPRIDAWIGRLLGPSSNWKFEVRFGGGSPKQIGLRDLGLSPVEVVFAARGGELAMTSELDERIRSAARVRFKVPGDQQIDIARSSAGDRLGRDELVALAGAIRRVLSVSDPVDDRTFARPDATMPIVAANDEIAARATRVLDQLGRVRDQLNKLLDTATTTTLDPAAVLDAAARCGARGVISSSADADERLDLIEVARDQLQASIEAAAQANEPLGKLRAALGSDMVITSAVIPASVLPTEAATKKLVDSDRQALVTWMVQRARVRPEVDALWHLLTGVEATTANFDVRSLNVLQLPEGARWIGSTNGVDPGVATPPPDTSVVIYQPTRSPANERTTGFVVDSWTERIPFPDHAVGVAMHIDAPAALPPQTALLAVPSPGQQWSTRLLVETVDEAIALSRLRGVHLSELDGIGIYLPTGHIRLDAAREFPSIDWKVLAQAGGTD